MKVILFTNARDEIHLNEWVAHHFLIGFDFIYIIDHLSKEPISIQAHKYLDNPKFKNKIFVKRENNDQALKLHFVKFAIAHAKNSKFDWMMYLDADEFLVLKKQTTVQDYIQSFLKKNNDAQQIGLPWVSFGSNFHDTEDSIESIIKNYTKSDLCNNNHIKSFLHIGSIRISEIQQYNPHYIKIHDHETSYYSNSSKYNKTDSHSINKIVKFNQLDEYIAHYQFQCYETFINRKCKRRRDDMFSVMFENVPTKKQFHKNANNVDNYEVYERYYDNIRNLMNNI